MGQGGEVQPRGAPTAVVADGGGAGNCVCGRIRYGHRQGVPFGVGGGGTADGYRAVFGGIQVCIAAVPVGNNHHRNYRVQGVAVSRACRRIAGRIHGLHTQVRSRGAQNNRSRPVVAGRGGVNPVEAAVHGELDLLIAGESPGIGSRDRLSRGIGEEVGG